MGDFPGAQPIFLSACWGDVMCPNPTEVTTSSSAECSGEPCTSTDGAAQAAADAPAAWAQAEAQAAVAGGETRDAKCRHVLRDSRR